MEMARPGCKIAVASKMLWQDSGGTGVTAPIPPRTLCRYLMVWKSPDEPA